MHFAEALETIIQLKLLIFVLLILLYFIYAKLILTCILYEVVVNTYLLANY